MAVVKCIPHWVGDSLAVNYPTLGRTLMAVNFLALGRRLLMAVKCNHTLSKAVYIVASAKIESTAHISMWTVFCSQESYLPPAPDGAKLIGSESRPLRFCLLC